MKKILLAMTLTGVAAAVPSMHSQAISVNGGAIQGTITDSSGAAIPNANIEIRSVAEGTVKTLVTDKSGFYSLGPLNPGEYKVTIASPGFQTMQVTTRVLTGTATPGSFKLSLGQASETIQVTTGDIQVNTDQAGVSDVITREQIASLPVNGRNFLDLAQIEPGVQLQNGNTFDPTKSGYTGIAVNGTSGRTTRILLDGQDITDEFVGTTILNVSQGAISEFQLNRSTQDVSGEVTSQGQVLVTTRSGSNAFHGDAFYYFQDQRAAFANPNGNGLKLPPYFQRNQYGGSVGGPIIKDKLFFFGNSERIQQASGTPSGIGSVFAGTVGTTNPTVGTPYKETDSTAKLDYNGPFGGHYFARGNYDVNSTLTAAGTNIYSAYANRDNTYGIAFGADFAKGRLTHSFRGSYEKFHNLIGDASGTSGYNPLTALVGSPVAYRYAGQLYFGPNANAPQATFQSDKQLRYDGSYTVGRHNIRYGGAVNRIQSGAYAAFYGIGPRINVTSSNALLGTVTPTNPAGLGCMGVVGATPCLSDPLNGYNTSSVTLGNGQGYSNSVPNFGLPGGGIAAWRASGYASDSWKVTPSFTFNAGVRYSVDTNRENNAITLPTCGDLSATVASACSGLAAGTKLYTLYDPSYTASHVRQPYGNFSPQAGLVYAPGNHKTTFRAGFGLFFESIVFNNTSNAESSLLKSGAFYFSKNPCTASTITLPSGTVVSASPDGTPLPTLCLQRTVAQSAAQFSALEKQLQTNTAANSTVSNGSFVGNTLNAASAYAPIYKQPYSEQWNFGLQREIFKGAVISADYIHNTTLKIGQTIDINHNGAARNFRQASAVSAVNNAALAYSVTRAGVATKPCATTSGTQAQVACLAANGASISTLATQGLGSTADWSSNNSYLYAGKAFPATFAGNNPILGSGSFIRPTGRSGYDALQLVYRQSTAHPVPGIDHSNLQISYNLSRVVSNLNSTGGGGGGDEFFSSAAYDNDNPSTYIGRNTLDRKHELSFGGSVDLKYGPQIGIIGHFFSAQPANLTLDAGLATGNIFQSDVTGDGTSGDIAPGTLPGAYMHGVSPSNLPAFIRNFNAQYAGKPTPAGQALINSGLFTLAQLTTLKGVIQPIAQVPTTGVGNAMFRSVDLNFAYPIRLSRLREGVSLVPSVAFYNVGNFSNFSNVSGVLQNTTTAGGAVNTGAGGYGFATGTNSFGIASARRTIRGVGTFSQGAPREAEFQLKLNF